MEKVVLSVGEEDVENIATAEQFKVIEEMGLMNGVLQRACIYIWDSIDCSNFFNDCLSDAIAEEINCAKKAGHCKDVQYA